MRTTGKIGALILMGLPTLILTSPAEAATPDCRTSVTNLVDRPDGGLNGTWALATFTRTVTICVVAQPEITITTPALSNYHAAVADEGSFVTIAGPNLSPGSPPPGAALAGGVPGTFTGGFTADFTATAAFATYTDPHDGETYTGAPPSTQPDSSHPSTGWWIATMFTGDITGSGLNDDWLWTYKTCTQTWQNATNAMGGNSGDITGTVCPTPPPAARGLPATGSDVGGILMAGGVALFVGTVLLAFAARRRTRPHA